MQRCRAFDMIGSLPYFPLARLCKTCLVGVAVPSSVAGRSAPPTRLEISELDGLLKTNLRLASRLCADHLAAVSTISEGSSTIFFSPLTNDEPARASWSNFGSKNIAAGDGEFAGAAATRTRMMRAASADKGLAGTGKRSIFKAAGAWGIFTAVIHQPPKLPWWCSCCSNAIPSVPSAGLRSHES